eukprot:Opistho-2@36224
MCVYVCLCYALCAPHSRAAAVPRFSAYAGPPTMTDHLEETLAHCQALYEAASLARTAAAMRSSADDRLSRIASGATTASEREEMYALYAAQCERRVDGARALHCELSGFVGSLRANGR